MAVFEQTNTVLTTVGRTLLADAQLGKGRIKITRVLARENFETTVSTLRAYTLSDIPDSSIAQEGHVLNTQIAITHPDPEQEVETSLLTVRFSNDELENSTDTYNLRQIIVMARLVDINSDENLPYAEDLGEVPYMVAQCSNYDEPDLMPPREDNPTSLDYDIYVIHSGVPTITIELRTSGYVFVDTYNTDKTEIWTSINELRDNAVGQNTKDLTFNTWTPVYSSNRTWSSESTGDTATGQKSAERFNQYGNDKNIATGNNSSAFGYNTEVLGNECVAFGVNNYIGATATQTLVAGSCNTVRTGAYNVVFGASNEVVNGTSNIVSGQANQVLGSTSNTVISGLENAAHEVQNSIVTGEKVEVYNTSGSIISGFNVTVGDSEGTNETVGSIITGISVTIDKGLYNSLVVGNDISISSVAQQNVTAIGTGIDINSSDVTVIGNNIALSGVCNDSAVFGTSHEVSSAQSVFIAGNSNTINASTSVASVAFNYNNTINASAHSAVFGYSNTITSGENTVSYGIQNSTTLSNNTLVGGYINNVTSSANALVVGSNHNVYSANNSIIYGNAVTATPDDTESLIGGNNCRVAHSSRSIVSGNNLTVDWVTDSSIHGINNRVYGEGQTHSNLIAGNSNIIHNDGGLGNVDNGKSLIVGTNNEVTDYSDSSLSGSDNNLENIMESSVTGKYITVHTIANQSRSIGVRNCSISGYNISVTQFESSVITGSNHTLTDYKPNNVAGEWNINSGNDFIGGESHTIAGIYSSIVTGFNHDIENIHDSVIAGRDNIISGGSTPASGVTNSVLAIGSRLNITNVQKPQAVFGSDNVVTGGGNILVSGHHLISSSDESVTLGKYNVADTTSQYAIVVGGGTADNSRSNICTLDWSGNLHIRGLYVSDILNEDGTPKDFGGIANISSGSGVQSILINDVNTNKATGLRSTAMGNNNTASGENSIAVGNTTQAQGISAISAGDNTKTTSDYSLVGGYGSQCINVSDSSILWGRSTTVTFSPQSAAFGYSNAMSFTNSGFISGINNVVCSELGNGTGTADNIDASAILGGENGYVNAHYSAIIGGKNNKIGQNANVGEVIKTGVILGGENNRLKGERCIVLGGYANSVGGYNSIVGGSSNHLNSNSNNMIVVGTSNSVGTTNNNSAVFGSGNRLNAHESFVAGRGLDTGTTAVVAQTIIGKWNIPDTDSLLIIGNGSDDDNRSNALRIDQNGNIFCGSDAQSLNAKIEAAVGGVTDYSDLDNKPQINGITLSGNKTGVDIKMPFLIVAGETYVIDGTEITANTGASIMTIGGSKAVGALSLAIGSNTIAKGDMSFAAGGGSKAVGNNSFAIGAATQAIGECSFSLGGSTQANGNYSFAGGASARAIGISSFSFGGGCIANGNYSFAVGGGCTTNGLDSFASGCETTADSDFQTVIGKYNTLDSNDKFAFIIGNGNNTHGTVRSNALAIGWDGKIYTGNNSQGINLETFYTAYSNTDTTVSALETETEENTAALIELIDSGAKNLLNPMTAVGYVGQSGYPISKSGITYTLDSSSETITLSDTASGVSTLRIPLTLPAGTYHMSGIPTGGSDNSYRADLREAGGNVFVTPDYDYGSGITFTLAETTAIDYCIRVANGYSPSNIVVSPMICLKAAWDISHRFVKYRPPYDDLISRIEALEQANNVNTTNSVTPTRKIIEDI